jgi:5-methylcytosine-specific restriction endonuclease McrA
MNNAATTTPTRKPQKRAGGERRGNSKDRAARRRFLIGFWGNGETCECVICGLTLEDHPREAFVGGVGPANHVEADKIVPHEDGPGYIRTNIFPSCRECNLARGDRDLREFAGSLGIDADAIIARAASAPRRGV